MTEKDDDLLKVPAFLRRKKGEAPEPPPAEEAPDDSWLDDPTELEPVELPDDMFYQRVYYVKGSAPKSWSTRYYISDPPNAGYSHAFVLGKPDAKRVTIFCPFTLEAFQVPRDAGELKLAKGDVEGPLTKGQVDRIVAIMQRNWKQYQGFGFQRDYDTAALVLKRLGAEVPEQVMRGGEEDTRKKGGKDVGSALLKPVKRTGKRGKFLAWFMEGDCTRSVREAMAEFSMTRSNALSYLYMLQKDHGIGYELVGDLATVHLPEGCEDPFEAEGLGKVKKEEPKKTEEPAASQEDDDDSWLD